MDSTQIVTVGNSLVRRLPGIAGRNRAGEIIFLRATVIYASSRIQWAETESKLENARLVFLVGATYMYCCAECRATVYEDETTRLGGPWCPFCRGHVQPIKRGQHLRVHFRFARDGSWAQWWGEVWDW